MTEAMKITLSTQPADARWGEKATYSINNDGITLHLNGADDLGLIQSGHQACSAKRRRLGCGSLLGILARLQSPERHA